MFASAVFPSVPGTVSPPVSYTVRQHPSTRCPPTITTSAPFPIVLESCGIDLQQHLHPHTWRGRWMGRRPVCLGLPQSGNVHSGRGKSALRRMATHLRRRHQSCCHRKRREVPFVTDSSTAGFLAEPTRAEGPCLCMTEYAPSLPTHQLVWTQAVGVPFVLAASPPLPSASSVNQFIHEE